MYIHRDTYNNTFFVFPVYIYTYTSRYIHILSCIYGVRLEENNIKIYRQYRIEK